MRIMFFTLFMILFGRAAGAADQITVSMFENQPFFYTDGDQIRGGLVDVMRQVFEKAQLPAPNFSIVPFARMIAELESSKDACVPIVARIPEREGKFVWIAEALRMRGSIIVTHDSSQEQASLVYLQQHQWAIVRGTVFETMLAQLNAQQVAVGDYEQIIRMVASKRAEGALMDLPSAMFTSNRLGVKIKTIGYLTDNPGYFTCARHTDPTIVEKLREAHLSLNQQHFYRKMFDGLGIAEVYESIKPNGLPPQGASFPLDPKN